MSFFGDIPDELIYSNELVDPPVNDTIGGLPPLGAGIAGIYTPSRKFGLGKPGQKPSKKFGEYGLTKGQVASVRGMKNEYGLKTGDKFSDGDTGYVWTINDKGGLEIVGSLNDYEWQVGDEVLFPEYEFDAVSDRRTMTGFGTKIYDPQDESGNPWVTTTTDEESPIDIPLFPSIIDDSGTVITPPIITTPPPTPPVITPPVIDTPPIVIDTPPVIDEPPVITTPPPSPPITPTPTPTPTPTGTTDTTGTGDTDDGTTDDVGIGIGDTVGIGTGAGVVDDDDTPFVPVDYTPFTIQNPVFEPRDFIAPGVSYSPEVPEGYTVFDDVYTPYVYDPPPVQQMSGPPLIYDPFAPLPSMAESITSLPTMPSGYQPLSLGGIQSIINKIGNT